MISKNHFLYIALFILLLSISPFQMISQTVKAVNDTIDLYPGIPVTINLLGNDTVPFGDSIQVRGGAYPGALVGIINKYKGFFTYLTQPIWGYDGSGTAIYQVIDYTLGKSSSAAILFRIHDHSYDSLSINNVKAAITAYGNEFWLPASPDSPCLFRIPANSQTGTMFNFSVWIGGKGSDSILYLAAEKYRQGPASSGSVGLYADYYAGPIMDSVNYSIYMDTTWSKTWKIQKSEIEYHKTHWNTPGYKAPVNILTWPGNGNTSFGEAAQLAPYHDQNNDGKYSALDGDYPLIRGDEAIFVIFNDDRNNHKDSGGKKMKLEFHLMAYAFDLPDDSAFKNTIFMNYQIINRSSETYYNTYLGFHADIDIGWVDDDYIGCDVKRSSVIGYNGVHADGTGQPRTYGEHPPAQSITILGGPFMDPTGHDRPRFDLTGHRLCNESVNGTGFGDSIADNERYGLCHFLKVSNFGAQQPAYMSDPTFPVEYYHSLQSIWLDSTQLFYGGKGHAGYDGYGPNCRFIYPGESDSLNWGTGCQFPNGEVNWTEITAHNVPVDIRGIGSAGPFTFRPGDVQQLDLAFVFARDYAGQDTLEPSVDKLRHMIDIVKNSFNTGALPNGHSFFSINDHQPVQSPVIKIFPNPAMGKMNILFNRSVNETVNIRMINISGVQIYSDDVIPIGKTVQLDVNGIAPGIYLIQVLAKDFTAYAKVIIHQ